MTKRLKLLSGLHWSPINSKGGQLKQVFQDGITSWAQKLVISGGISYIIYPYIPPISRVKFHTIETHVFSAIYRGPIRPFITIVGLPTL